MNMLRFCPIFLAALLLSPLANATTFQVRGTDAAPWIDIFRSVGIVEASGADPDIIVAGSRAQLDASRVANNHILILEGPSAVAQSLGFVPEIGRAHV